MVDTKRWQDEAAIRGGGDDEPTGATRLT